MQQEKLMLIDSMTKLISHISNNRKHQSEIYSNLSRTDVTKIISNFDDQNSLVRKTSAQLLCQMIYNNSEIKYKFLSDMGIQPPNGNIVLGRVHKRNNIGQILLKIKMARINMNGALCWYINLDHGRIQTLRKGQQFIDPLNCLFGITSDKEHSLQPLRFMQTSERWSAQKQKQYNRQNGGRTRAQNNTMYLPNNGNRKQLLVSSRKPQQQQKILSSTYRQSTHSGLQSSSPKSKGLITSLNNHFASKIRTTSNTDQLSFQSKLKQYQGIYMPKTTRYNGNTFGESIGYIRTNRDSSVLNGSLQETYIRVSQNNR